MYVLIYNTNYVHNTHRQETVHTSTYVRTLIKRKIALFHSQIRMYIQTNLTKIICTVQVLALIGNLYKQPGMMPTYRSFCQHGE